MTENDTPCISPMTYIALGTTSNADFQDDTSTLAVRDTSISSYIPQSGDQPFNSHCPDDLDSFEEPDNFRQLFQPHVAWWLRTPDVNEEMFTTTVVNNAIRALSGDSCNREKIG